MSKKNKKDAKSVEFKLIVPNTEPDVVGIGRDINKFITHAIYIKAEDATEKKMFIYGDFCYYVMFGSMNGKVIPVGVMVKDFEAEDKDIAILDEDPIRDVNVMYPIAFEKEFAGFYILRNGGIAIEYELTADGKDHDEGFGRIDMNLN